MREAGRGEARPLVVAVGGGGFTHGIDSALEDFMLAQIASARPRVGYVGTANDDDPVRIRRFYERFAGIAGASHLPVAADAAAARGWVAGLDLVYVAGGSTFRLLQHWRRTGIDHVMLDAARSGTLMAGVSAGAMIWFAEAFSDSAGNGFEGLPCLGLVAGSCCPHYDSEPVRPPEFEAAIASGRVVAGIAVDDGAAVVIGSDGPLGVVAARPGAGGRVVRRDGDAARSEALPIL